MKVTTEGCLFGAWVVERIQNMDREPKRVLDIGTGTGLLSLMIAQVTQETVVEALEINKQSYQDACANFIQSPWKKRLLAKNKSLQAFDPEKQYKMIVCNPPFFKQNKKGTRMNKNQAVHNDDLSMEDLSNGINRLLLKNGSAFVIYPEWEMQAFEKWMEKNHLFPFKRLLIRNKENGPTFRLLVEFTREKINTSQEELTIRNEDGSYTQKFVDLLEAFYLFEETTKS